MTKKLTVIQGGGTDKSVSLSDKDWKLVCDILDIAIGNLDCQDCANRCIATKVMIEQQLAKARAN